MSISFSWTGSDWTLPPRSQRRTGWVALLAWCLIGFCCGGAGESVTNSLPSLPSHTILAGFDAEIQRQIQAAYSRVESDPGSPSANGRMGMVLHAYALWDTALLFYERARNLDPRDARWSYYYAVAAAESGDLEDAASSFQDALQREPGDLAARLRMAEALAALGRTSESERHFRELSKSHSNVARVHFGLAEALTAAGRAEEASESYRRAIELAPDYGAAHYGLAIRYREQGEAARFEEQMNLFERHRGAEPAFPDPRIDEVEALRKGAMRHFRLALQLEKQGQIDQAIAAYRESIRAEPDQAQAVVNLLGLLIEQGRFEEVDQIARSQIEAGTAVAEIHHLYGSSLSLRQRSAEAASAYRRALELNPQLAEAHHDLGVALRILAKPTEAEDHYRRALAIDPSHQRARFNLAEVLFVQKRYQDAIDILRDRDPQSAPNAREMDLLANAYSQVGDWERALASSREAVRLAETSAEPELRIQARYHLARILFLRKSFSEAARVLTDPPPDPSDRMTPAMLYLLANAQSGMGDQKRARETATRALGLARRMGQNELAETIEQSLGGGRRQK